jgi:hypothetical protein
MVEFTQACQPATLSIQSADVLMKMPPFGSVLLLRFDVKTTGSLNGYPNTHLLGHGSVVILQ